MGHSFLTHLHSPCPAHTLYPGHWAWVPTPPNRSPRDSPVWLHSTLPFFWSERETDRNKEEEDQESQASYSLAQTPGMPGSTQKPGPQGGVPPRSRPPRLVSASPEVGLAGTCIHTGCVLPGTFPPADCSDTGS